MNQPCLSPDHCQAIDTVLQALPAQKEFCQKCIRAGMPAEEILAKLEAQERQATAIKAEFYPHNP